LHVFRLGDDAGEAELPRKGSDEGGDLEETRGLSKKELRMLRNRQSAAASRRRQRELIESLQQRNEELTQTKRALLGLLERYVRRYGLLEGMDEADMLHVSTAQLLMNRFIP
jgi:hypothetical protein